LPNLQPFNTRPLASATLASTASLREATALSNSVAPNSIDVTHDINRETIKDVGNIVKQNPSPSSSSDGLFRLAPPLTFDKFLTMQVKTL
jgi:hypothetical protein